MVWARVYSPNNPQPLPQDLSIAGNISSNGGGIYEQGQRVYSSNNPQPLPHDLYIAGNISSDAGIYERGQRVYSPNNPQPAQDLSGYATMNWVASSFVSGISRGAQASMVMDGLLVEAPAGCVLTGGNGNEGSQIGYALYRPLQMYRNGSWVTIDG
ncbi:hypothetical protein [Ewingella americana]